MVTDHRSAHIVREAEVLAIDPDERAAELAGELVEGKHQVRAAFDQMTGSGDAATAEADAALAAERRMENGEWRMENGEWRMENGESLPAGHARLLSNADLAK